MFLVCLLLLSSHWWLLPAVASVSAVLLIRYVPGMPAIVGVPVVGNIHAIASVSSPVVFQ